MGQLIFGRKGLLLLLAVWSGHRNRKTDSMSQSASCPGPLSEIARFEGGEGGLYCYTLSTYYSATAF